MYRTLPWDTPQDTLTGEGESESQGDTCRNQRLLSILHASGIVLRALHILTHPKKGFSPFWGRKGFFPPLWKTESQKG